MIYLSADFGGTFRIFKVIELSLDKGVPYPRPEPVFRLTHYE
jgi:hypothetical protein